ncbi:helix-turn-helix domain-containing protein [Streptomyces sp. NPDC058548]|uniref:helix-turn-helix domain-containing protein n=1 Tax=Streptomyces sp. NPDC058548 TaxID=3346545 RepID=UPI0036676B39
MDTTPPGESPAGRFGALVTRLAEAAGYDTKPRAGGRQQLARDTGMSTSAVGRMLDGQTLPMPSVYESIAKAVQVDVRTLLVEGGVISSDSWPEDGFPDVRSVTDQSQALSPEAAVDAWGITNPSIRQMLLGNIEQAIRLQRESELGTASSRRS